ncbi:unnamed protein product [Amaranthus hypochondriacus]
MSSEGERSCGEWTIVGRRNGRRKDRLGFQISNTNRHFNRPGLEVGVGHRGLSRHQWWRGPREPPPSLRGQGSSNSISLFVDGIARSVSLHELRALFEQEGQVNDVYISGKKRNHTKESFGFVRFSKEHEAVKAVHNLDGVSIRGGKLKISMAKYSKGGIPISKHKEKIATKPPTQPPVLRDQHRTQQPAFRDQRQYSEALEGRRRVPTSSDPHQKMTANQVPIKLFENHVIVKRLKHAIVIEDDKLPCGAKISELINNCNLHVTCLSSLSPYKIVLFLEDELNVKEALSEKSTLRTVFQNVRRWTDDECSNERLVWLDCHGIHPKCWSNGNFSLIGNKWGRTIRFENVRHEFNCLTSVRILVRTKIHKHIDEWVTIQWESGSCEIWVREVIEYADNLGENLVFENQIEDDPNNCDVNQFLSNNEDDTAVNVHNEGGDAVNEEKSGEPAGVKPFKLQQPIDNEMNNEKTREDLGVTVENMTHGQNELHDGNGLEIVEMGLVTNCGGDTEGTQTEMDNRKDESMDQSNLEAAATDMVVTQLFVNGVQQIEEQILEPHCMTNDTTHGSQEGVISDSFSLQRVGLGNEDEGVQIDPVLNGICEPLIVEFDANRSCFEETVWFDPIANLEANVCNSPPRRRLDGVEKNTNDRVLNTGEASNKKQRGRPKRASKTATVGHPTSSSHSEPQQAWQVVKMLGVSSNDEGEVLSQLRKSRRIHNMEHNLS